ncbi:hypothetical protein ACIQAA_27895 [Neobacillus sp. NPDC093182]|uniref:hypothetical protein n=1 Tax=Neobacillus sp. NPDC093182 TaxID=3364297 RepID=UPI0037F2A666
MNLKFGSIEGFEGYSHFKSVKEFNTHKEMWLAVKKHEFSKGELVGLKRMVRFPAKVPGGYALLVPCSGSLLSGNDKLKDGQEIRKTMGTVL